MRIVGIRARNIGFSRAPKTLQRHLVSNVSVFDDAATREGGWFGPAFCTVVEIRTSNGLVGLGTAGAFSGAAKSIVEKYFAPIVMGEDPRRHEYLWQRLYRSSVRFGRAGAAISALSAIDIACWDLHGKAEERSVTDLLGGQSQKSVPAYASRLYALEDLDELAEQAKGFVADGFMTLKQRFGFGPSAGAEGMRRNVQLVETVRDAVGEDVELAADAYMGWNVRYAMEMAERLRDFRLAWIEEPLMPHDFDGYAQLAQRSAHQRWSCGEHLYTKWEFARLLGRGAIDIVQPDVNRVGGLTEAKKICALAETAGVPVVPHSNEAHNVHLVFSQISAVCPIVEYFPDVEPDTGNELFWKLFSGNIVADRGSISMGNHVAGLGIGLNETVANDLLVEDGEWITS